MATDETEKRMHQRMKRMLQRKERIKENGIKEGRQE
jgi:hypothetical protein